MINGRLYRVYTELGCTMIENPMYIIANTLVEADEKMKTQWRNLGQTPPSTHSIDLVANMVYD